MLIKPKLNNAWILTRNFLRFIPVLLLFSSGFLKAQNIFNKGVNLTNWFQASSVNEIQFNRYSRQDLVNIKSLGCDVIRLPINLNSMTLGSPDYIIDPVFFNLLDSAVTWAEELNIKLILDNHSFDPAVNTDPGVGDILVKVWSQMAEHYKNHSPLILYEVLNEPHGITTQLWGSIQQTVIDSIRAVDTRHTIVVGASDYNTYTEMENLPVYSDTNLLYTFHFYDPFVFTHQGATWVSPSMIDLAGVPFPYNKDSMPVCPASLKGSWVESNINSYSNDGTVANVQNLIDIAIKFRDSRKVPIYCGELGAYNLNSINADRVYWYQIVRSYLETNKIPWTSWDYQDGFGLFKKGSNELFQHDLNVPLLQALGLNVPAQTQYIERPDTTGFIMYSDFIGSFINESDWTITLLLIIILLCIRTTGIIASPGMELPSMVILDLILLLTVTSQNLCRKIMPLIFLYAEIPREPSLISTLSIQKPVIPMIIPGACIRKLMKAMDPGIKNGTM